MDILVVNNLCKTYGNGYTKVEALKDVSFTVSKGEFVTVVGESGSGKSTLLNLLGGLDTPTSGKIFVDGKEICSMKEEKQTIFRRRNIGFIFQSYNLIPELTVEVLTILGLKDRKSHLPNQLSGGQQQRVAIGRALITKPSIILADEPTGNLDSKNSSDVISLLKVTAEKYNQTIIMITHNTNIASTADRILQVSDGMLKDLGVNREWEAI